MCDQRRAASGKMRRQRASFLSRRRPCAPAGWLTGCQWGPARPVQPPEMSSVCSAASDIAQGAGVYGKRSRTLPGASPRPRGPLCAQDRAAWHSLAGAPTAMARLGRAECHGGCRAVTPRGQPSLPATTGRIRSCALWQATGRASRLGACTLTGENNS